MELISQLSSSLGRRDQQPNISLGFQIAQEQNVTAVKEIRFLLGQNSSIETLCDLIKVLESIGEISPKMIAGFYPILKKLINHPENFVVWRAMCVLSQIAHYHAEKVYEDLGSILTVMDQGSVITRDHGFNILVALYQKEQFRADISPLIVEQLWKAPDNQLGQYAEKWMKVIDTEHTRELISILQNRMTNLIKEAHQKRCNKILTKLHKKK